MNSNNEVINILPIGDSITDGAGTHSGYRFFLHNLLYKSGINFRFAGPKKAHDPRMPERYYYHAGYGGNTIGPDNSQPGAHDSISTVDMSCRLSPSAPIYP